MADDIQIENDNAELLYDKSEIDSFRNQNKNAKKKKKREFMNRYVYQPKNTKNDHYYNDGFHTSNFVYKSTDNRMFTRENKEIVIALFPDKAGSIVFVDSQVDYPEIENVECDQCYISELETNELDVQTLFMVNIEIESETPEFHESMKMKFPNDAMNIVLICIIIVITAALYVIAISVICIKLRIRNDLDENNNNNNDL